MGGVQTHIEEVRRRLTRYESDVVTLWLKQRTDWLLGTTLRLSDGSAAEAAPGVRTIGWPAATRARMAPWAAVYYAIPRVASQQIAAQMVPFVEKAVRPDHALIHNHRIGREFLAQASLIVARRRGIPFILSPHHHPKWKGYRYAGWLDVYRAADRVITQTQAEVKELEGLGVQPEKLVAVGGAADEPIAGDAARFRARIAGTEEPVVLFVGQMYEYKGMRELLQAADALHARGRRFQLVFIGPHTRFSERLFARESRPWLHVLGLVSPEVKADALEAATVLCQPSRHEAFGRVFLEAWSKRKPVIGARIAAVGEVITEGETGLLAAPGDVDELAAAIDRVLGDPDLAARLGANGEREVLTRFSWDQVIERLEAVYDTVLGTAARRQEYLKLSQ